MAQDVDDYAYPVPAPADLSDPELLRRGFELHFYSHLELAEDADRQLRDMGFGRPHHRILYVTHRRPGISVSELNKVLRITHQGMLRQMNQLLDGGFLEQKTAERDRRRRLLFVTNKGAQLVDQLSALQYERLAFAYHRAGPEAVAGFWTVLHHMITDPCFQDSSDAD